MEVADRLGAWLPDLALGAVVWLTAVLSAIFACRQPARRRDLSRLGMIGALLLIPASAMVPAEGRIALGGSICDVAGPVLEALLPDRLGPIRSAFPGQWLATGYVVGVGLGISWSLMGAWALRRLVRGSTAPSASAAIVFAPLPFDGPPERRPILRVSDRVRRPVLVGVRRPIIVIPEGWDRPEAEAGLRLALLHELAHAERLDPLHQWLSGIAQALWFVVPMAWWIRYQLSLDQEILADAKAARNLGDSTASYAATLVAVAIGDRDGDRPEVRPRGEAVTPSIRTDGSTIVKRVAMLVACPFPIEPKAPAWWRLALLPASASALWLAARLSVAEAPSPVVSEARGPLVAPFHLEELTAEPCPSPATIRLPYPLPDRFEVTFRILADPGTLPMISVAGVFLGTGQPSTGGPEVWHDVLLRSEGGRIPTPDRRQRRRADPRPGCDGRMALDPTPLGASDPDRRSSAPADTGVNQSGASSPRRRTAWRSRGWWVFAGSTHPT